jgi:hypothetical protein
MADFNIIFNKVSNWKSPWMKGSRPIPDSNFFFALTSDSKNRKVDCYSKTVFNEAPKCNLSELELSSLAGVIYLMPAPMLRVQLLSPSF